MTLEGVEDNPLACETQQSNTNNKQISPYWPPIASPKTSPTMTPSSKTSPTMTPKTLPRHLLLKCHVSFPPSHVPVPGDSLGALTI